MRTAAEAPGARWAARTRACLALALAGALAGVAAAGCSLLFDPTGLGEGADASLGGGDAARDDAADASSEAPADGAADSAAPFRCGTFDAGPGWRTLFCDDFDEGSLAQRLDGGWCWPGDGGLCWRAVGGASQALGIDDAAAASPPSSLTWTTPSPDAGLELALPDASPGQVLVVSMSLRVDQPPACVGPGPTCAVASVPATNVIQSPFHFWLEYQDKTLWLHDDDDAGPAGPYALKPPVDVQSWASVEIQVQLDSSDTQAWYVSAASSGYPLSASVSDLLTSRPAFVLGPAGNTGKVRYDDVTVVVSTPP